VDFYTLNFFGIKRELPITYISRDKRIANIHLVGDIELVEKAGDELEKNLKKYKFDYIVSPSIKVSNLIHNLALRFKHKRYIVLRKSIKGYMVKPKIQKPEKKSPKHVGKLVLNKMDADLIKGKNVVLIDDVISTSSTIELATKILQEAGAKVIFRAGIFKQGNRKIAKNIFYLAKLPILTSKE
jgi:adenine phosphoribosyltransferase